MSSKIEIMYKVYENVSRKGKVFQFPEGHKAEVRDTVVIVNKYSHNQSKGLVTVVDGNSITVECYYKVGFVDIHNEDLIVMLLVDPEPKRKVWMTGTWDKDSDKSDIFFHVREEDFDGTIRKYKFRGIDSDKPATYKDEKDSEITKGNGYENIVILPKGVSPMAYRVRNSELAYGVPDTTNDKGFMEWIHNRLLNVHNEPDYVDYMVKLREIIDKMEEK